MADKKETIRLLLECDAGTGMGIESLAYVIKDLPEGKVRSLLEKSKAAHETLRQKIAGYLKEFQEEGKDPALMASLMARMKERMKMAAEDNEESAAASLIIDGCNMGIKSICRYFNQYPNAEDRIRQLVYEIVKEEEDLCRKLRCYL